MRESKKFPGGFRKDGATWYVRFLSSTNLPPRKAITAVFVVPFYNDHIVAVNIQEDDHQGWDIPGGYLNEDESIEEALHREVQEEASIKLNKYKLIGYLESDYDFKRTTYMIIFWGQVTDLEPFKVDFEAVERKLMTPKEFLEHYSGGNLDLLKIILEVALTYHQKQKQR